MISIKKDDIVVTIQQNGFMAISETPDGVYFKFRNGVELIIPIQLNDQIKAAIMVVQKSPAKNIELNFNTRQVLNIIN